MIASGALVTLSSRAKDVSVRRAPAKAAIAKAAVMPASKPSTTKDRQRLRTSAPAHSTDALSGLTKIRYDGPMPRTTGPAPLRRWCWHSEPLRSQRPVTMDTNALSDRVHEGIIVCCDRRLRPTLDRLYNNGRRVIVSTGGANVASVSDTVRELTAARRQAMDRTSAHRYD